MNSRTNKFFLKAIKKMFYFAGERYSPEKASWTGWYLNYTLTPAQAKKFKKWFILNATKDLKISKTQAKKGYEWFDFGYGFPTKF